MKKLAAAISVLLLFSVSCIGKEERIPIYVTPLYNSQPLSVNVGEYSKALETRSLRSLRKTAAIIRENIDQVNVPALYVLAIRLYDMGAKDEAVYWFYTAQLRARLFTGALTLTGGMGEAGFELKHALNAFFELAGPYINGYAYCDIDRLIATVEKVLAEMPTDCYFGKVHPNISFCKDCFDDLVEKNQKGMRDYIEWLDTSREEIKTTRKENGLDEKFCK